MRFWNQFSKNKTGVKLKCAILAVWAQARRQATMADDKLSDHEIKIRKLRKKLRQIENLQRLSGLRDLSEEETTKVKYKSNSKLCF